MGKKQKKQQQKNETIFQAFLSGIPYECNEDNLERFLGSADGIVSIKLPRYQDSNKCRGYAHIKFNNQQAYKHALSLNRSYLKQRYITIEPAKGEKQVQPINSIPVGCKTLFVKGLPYSMSEEGLKKQFGSCGGIVDIRMVRNWGNKNFKGFAYIEYKEAGSLKKAVNKYHNKLFEGRRLICDASTSTAKKGYKKRNPDQQKQEQPENEQ